MLYYLVDRDEAGRVVHRTQFMEPIELAREREECEIHSGGEFMWFPVSKEMAALPKHETFVHILLSVKLYKG